MDSRLLCLNQISQRKLTEILVKIPGKKDLIIDPRLMKPLEQITGVSVLRSHGVHKIHKLEKSGFRYVSNHWVYLVYSDLITTKYICDQINADLQCKPTNSYYIIFVPCELVAVLNLLEEEGVFGLVTVYRFMWEMISLDSSVLSFELPNLFHTLFVDGDKSFLPAMAHSLWSLQILFGKIPMTVTCGKFASQVCKILHILSKELGNPTRQDSDIDCLVVVDRDFDYASVLLTAVTYAGLLDEVFGVKCGTVEFDEKVTGTKGTVNYRLTDADDIYHEMKNRHFSDVYSFLSTKKEELHSEYKRCQKMGLQEMKQYVATDLQKVKEKKRSLSYHIGACEIIIGEMGHRYEALHKFEQNTLEGKSRGENFTYLEDCLATQCVNKFTCLRLLCLMCLTQNGLTQDESSTFMKQFLHAYGYENLTLFYNLEKLGLFVRHDADTGETTGKLTDRVAQVVSLNRKSSAFHSIAQKLKLFPEIKDDFDLKKPKDMGYVFSGAYIPAVCQLVNLLTQQDMPLDDITKLLPGIQINTFSKDTSKLKRKNFLVYFIGGVTYAEIAAFQLLEKFTDTRIIVAGTGVINGCSLMRSVE